MESMGLQRLASRIVVSYIHRFPQKRGTWRLLQLARSFLIVETERGRLIRVNRPPMALESAVVSGQWIEEEEAARFLDLIRPGMTVFDIGANLGLYSLMAGKRVGPSGSVHAFEPTPQLVRKLRDNAKLNGFANITVNQLAISDECGTVDFYLSDEDDCSSLARISHSAIPVNALTLDDYMTEQGIDRVDLMKVDVEGAEVKVFSGGRKLFGRSDAPTILLEINPPSLETMGTSEQELTFLLCGYGYALTTVTEHGLYRNVLATKR